MRVEIRPNPKSPNQGRSGVAMLRIARCENQSLSFGTLNLGMGMRTGLPGMSTGANCNPEGVTLRGILVNRLSTLQCADSRLRSE